MSAGKKNPGKNWPTDHAVYDKIYAVPDPRDCPSTFPAILSGWQNFFVDLRRKVATEHPVELAFVAAIIRAMGTGEFRERALQSGALDPDFLETTLFEDLLSAPPLKGGYTDLNRGGRPHVRAIPSLSPSLVV